MEGEKNWVNALELYKYKTVGYQQHNFRLPIFVKKALKKMKTFFFSKKHSFFITVSTFSNFNSFPIFSKKLHK